MALDVEDFFFPSLLLFVVAAMVGGCGGCGMGGCGCGGCGGWM